ncbi:MAG: hypothetical protein LBO66_13910 [Deltaproteobacteria bacterium]|nr:hypothetical protein [Deltaproteobacteria bacterium]
MKVVVVNPRRAKNIPGSETDMSDSLWLAQLGRFGLPRSSYISPPEFACARHLSRLNQKITRDLAKSGNRVIKRLVKLGVRLDLVARDVFGKSSRPRLRASSPARPRLRPSSASTRDLRPGATRA